MREGRKMHVPSKGICRTANSRSRIPRTAGGTSETGKASSTNLSSDFPRNNFRMEGGRKTFPASGPWDVQPRSTTRWRLQRLRVGGCFIGSVPSRTPYPVQGRAHQPSPWSSSLKFRARKNEKTNQVLEPEVAKKQPLLQICSHAKAELMVGGPTCIFLTLLGFSKQAFQAAAFERQVTTKLRRER